MFEFISLAPPKDAQINHEPEDDDNDEDAYDPTNLDNNNNNNSNSSSDDSKDEDSDDDISLIKLKRSLNTSKTQSRLLSFDKGAINILADPGWDGISDLTYLDSIIPKIDLIILSQTTNEYIGAFALLLYKYPILKKIKTYSTLPIAKLGRLSTIELYRANGLVGALEDSLLEVQDIESCFNSIITLNYSQRIALQGKLSGISITAYNSGHSLGGSIWLLAKEAEKIVYAPAWNHSKDLFLNSSILTGKKTSGSESGVNSLVRPTTLITGSDLGSTISHKKRVDKFIELVQLTLLNSTSILLPTSMTGRIFELLPLLDQAINKSIPFFVVSYTGVKSLNFSSNMLEWMAPDITKKWESQSQSQSQTMFDSTRLRLITLQELVTLEIGPKIVFVDGIDMNEGSLSRTCFMQLCSLQNTALILTERPEVNSTSFEIFKYWEDQTKQDDNLTDGSLIILEKEFPLTIIKEEPIHGSELNSYNKRVLSRRQHQKELELEERKNDDLLDTMIGEDDEDLNIDDEEDEDEDGDDEEDENENEQVGADGTITKTKKTTTSTAIKQSTHHNSTKDQDENITVEEILKLPMDFDVRTAKGKNRMFPYIVKKVSIDDYGEVIKHDEFLREEEKFVVKRNDSGFGGNNYNNGNGNQYSSDGDDYDDDDNYDDDYNDEVLDNGKRRRRNNGRNSTGKRSRRYYGNGQQQARPADVDSLFNLDPLVDPKSRTRKMLKVEIRCGLTFVDLSGLVDLRSMRITINALKPRKVIILPNTSYGFMGDSYDIMDSIRLQQEKKLTDLYNQNSSSLGTDYIRCILNENIDLGNVITSYDLQLDPELSKSLHWQTITGGYSIAHVNGEISTAATAIDTNSSSSPSFCLKLPEKNSNMIPGLNSISIGDIRLSEFRKKLTSLNHIAEFKGDGTLVVDHQLAIRKIGDGNLIIDGGVGKLFYEVRELVQSMLAYV